MSPHSTKSQIANRKSKISKLYPGNNSVILPRALFSQGFVVVKLVMAIHRNRLGDARTNKVQIGGAASAKHQAHAGGIDGSDEITVGGQDEARVARKAEVDKVASFTRIVHARPANGGVCADDIQGQGTPREYVDSTFDVHIPIDQQDSIAGDRHFL